MTEGPVLQGSWRMYRDGTAWEEGCGGKDISHTGMLKIPHPRAANDPSEKEDALTFILGNGFWEGENGNLFPDPANFHTVLSLYHRRRPVQWQEQ